MTIKNPTSGSVWYGGQHRVIQWSFVGASPDATVSIFIQDIKNGYVGKPHPYPIATKLPAAPVSAGIVGYRWQIPYAFRTSDGYQISIVAEYPGEDVEPLVAVMDGTFKIVQVGDAGQVTQLPYPMPTIVP